MTITEHKQALVSINMLEKQDLANLPIFNSIATYLRSMNIFTSLKMILDEQIFTMEFYLYFMATIIYEQKASMTTCSLQC